MVGKPFGADLASRDLNDTGSQNRTPPVPESGKTGLQASVPARQGADLRVWVELRGFEPLTPSMRTRPCLSAGVGHSS